MRLDRYQEAVSAYKRAVTIKPGDAVVHYSLGVAYLRTGNADGAMEQYTLLKDIDAQKAAGLLKLINP